MSGYIAELFYSAGAKPLPLGEDYDPGLTIKDTNEPVYISGYKPEHRRYERTFYYDGTPIARITWDTRIPIEEATINLRFDMLWLKVSDTLIVVNEVLESIKEFIGEHDANKEN